MLDLLPLAAAIAFSTPSPRGQGSPLARPSPASAPADALLSRRAMRRARLLIELRLHELRDERLQCVRAAILRRLPADLRPEEPPVQCLEAQLPPE